MAFISVTEKKEKAPYHASLLGYLHENKTYVKELNSQTDDKEQQKVEFFVGKMDNIQIYTLINMLFYYKA